MVSNKSGTLPLSSTRRNTNKAYATARGLQLPICSLDPHWQ